jgi:alpha-amylase/alpha-mannosidase (GH57 family)
MDKYVCLHGHFYQPPRGNPWLEDVELQDSAHPYHDWKEKITEECYRQNSESRILDPERKIIDITNNYSKMSFDFGPTLLLWLERHALLVYESIIDADKESRERLSGHGAAMAQAYIQTLENILETLQVISALVDHLDLQTAQNILFGISKKGLCRSEGKGLFR